jgi:hypothetical protein
VLESSRPGAERRLCAQNFRSFGTNASRRVDVADVEADEFGKTQAGTEGQGVDHVVADVAGGRGEDWSNFVFGEGRRAEVGHVTRVARCGGQSRQDAPARSGNPLAKHLISYSALAPDRTDSLCATHPATMTNRPIVEYAHSSSIRQTTGDHGDANCYSTARPSRDL